MIHIKKKKKQCKFSRHHSKPTELEPLGEEAHQGLIFTDITGDSGVSSSLRTTGQFKSTYYSVWDCRCLTESSLFTPYFPIQK